MSSIVAAAPYRLRERGVVIYTSWGVIELHILEGIAWAREMIYMNYNALAKLFDVEVTPADTQSNIHIESNIKFYPWSFLHLYWSLIIIFF